MHNRSSLPLTLFGVLGAWSEPSRRRQMALRFQEYCRCWLGAVPNPTDLFPTLAAEIHPSNAEHYFGKKSCRSLVSS
jgi:hypothetical protein